MRNRYLQYCIFACLTSFCLMAQASLLISPTRVALDERERSAEVILINSGDTTQTYRLEWKEYQAKSEGGYDTIPDEQLVGKMLLSRMTRLSPKQVTLAPGETQTVKIAVRRPNNLPAGEYRSHLQFTALPPATSQADDSNQMSIRIQALMSYAIPIIMRQGALESSATITDIGIRHDKVNNRATVQVSLTRQGKHSSSGSLKAFWTPQNSRDERQVAVLNGYNLHHDLKVATANLIWSDFTLTPGQLRIIYEGRQEFAGQILAQKTLVITPAMIRDIP